MPLDPSIIQGIQHPQIMSPAQAISLRNMARNAQLQQLQLAEAQRQAAAGAQTRQIYSNPANVDPSTGTLSPSGISSLAGVDPSAFEAAGQARRVALAQLSMEAQRKEAQQEKRAGVLKNVGRTTVQAYDLALERTGGNVQEATRAATMARNEALDELWTSGQASTLGLGDQDRQKALGSPVKIDDLRAKFFTPEELSKANQPKSSLGKLEADHKAHKISDADYLAEKKKMTAPTTAMLVPPTSFEGKNGELLAALAERGVSLPTGFRSKEQQVALLNGLRERNPGLSPDEIADKVKNGQIDLANVKKAGQVAAGIAGKVAYAENEIEQTIPLVREASAKLPRGQFIPYNKLKQMGEANFSNPDLAEFRMYMTSLSNAYDMLAARGGTDVEKRAENRRNFETAQSPEALERVLRAVQKEAQASGRAAAAAMKPPGEKPSGAKGSAPAAAVDYLKAHPETKDAFKAKYGYLPDGG